MLTLVDNLKTCMTFAPKLQNTKVTIGSINQSSMLLQKYCVRSISDIDRTVTVKPLWSRFASKESIKDAATEQTL